MGVADNKEDVDTTFILGALGLAQAAQAIAMSPSANGDSGTASQRALTADPNPSATGSYAVRWLPPSFSYDHYFRLSESAHGASFKTVYTGIDFQYQASGKAEGSCTYRLQACRTGRIPRDTKRCDTPYPDLAVQVRYQPESPISARTGAGGMSYETGVTKGGDGYVNVPVAPVPGVNGLQPALSFDYSDGRERQRVARELPGDILGYGWRLSGFSAIRRCVRHQRGNRGISLDDTDGLCLDGEPLVLIDGTHLHPGAEYRTLRESFAKIVVKPGDAAGEAPWFEARLPDGTVREYGRTPESSLRFLTLTTRGNRQTRQFSVPFLWSIGKETDAFGNEMRHEYHEDEAAGARHPKRIVYGDEEDAEMLFEYAGRSDLATVPVGGANQSQWLRLHRLRVLLDGEKVREYRLESEKTAQGWRRLKRLQLCGYRSSGDEDCLPPLTVGWENPDATLPHLQTCVNEITDPLGKITSFSHDILTTNGTHAFLFSARSSPFGGGKPPADAQALSGTASGNVKPVVTEIARSNGIGGWHRTRYAYQGRGWESTRGWGFLGFYATQETDTASGIVTYAQYRLDFLYYGQASAMAQYDRAYGSSGAQALSKRFVSYAKKDLSHGAEKTYLPYAPKTTELIYEGGRQLGARQIMDTPTLSRGQLAKLVRTVRTGHAVSSRGGGTPWGAVADYALGDVQRKTESTIRFANRTANQWLIGFVNQVAAKHYQGSSTLSRTQSATMTAYGDTNAVDAVTRFSSDSSLRLVSEYDYDARGNMERTLVSGGNVAARRSTASGFGSAGERHPTRWTNAAGHVRRAAWDVRLGLPTSLTDANGRVTRIGYDGFGREVARTQAWDGVTESTTYAQCTACAAVSVRRSSCGGGGGTVSVTPAMKSTTTSPTAPRTVRYYDALGRVIRTDVQSFDGSGERRQDVFYNDRGLVACESQPHLDSETAHYTAYRYDGRGRLASETRPDGGRTSIAYAADARSHRVKTTTTETVRRTGSSTTRKREEWHNVLGELVQSVDGAHGNSRQRVGTSYAYDGSGLPTQVVVDGDYATAFRYDAAGNRTRVTNPDAGTTTFAYTALGELRQRTDPWGTTSYEYDKLGRRTKRTDADGTVARWAYDPRNGRGRLASRSYGGTAFTETYAYNMDARLSTKTTRTRIDGTSRTWTHRYGYDAQGRPETVAYPSGLTVEYVYNRRGYLSEVLDRANAKALVTYDAMDAYGNVTREVYGNGVRTVRDFDAASGRPTAIDTALGRKTLQANRYAWRSDGLLAGGRARRGAAACNGGSAWRPSATTIWTG